MKSVLFVSTGNGGRTAMAEGLARQMFGDGAKISSAGIEAGHLHPAAVEVMKEINIDIRQHVPQSLEPEHLRADLIVIVCGKSLELEVPTKARRMHWPFPDPADPFEPASQVVERFRETRIALSKHLKGLVRMMDDRPLSGAYTT